MSSLQLAGDSKNKIVNYVFNIILFAKDVIGSNDPKKEKVLLHCLYTLIFF